MSTRRLFPGNRVATFALRLPRERRHYLWDELKQGVGVERADGQRYEEEQQPLVKGFLHEGHHARPDQRTQRDQCHTEDPITPH